MYVRIYSGIANFIAFEFDAEYTRLTPRIERLAKEAIFNETGIRPEEQNAIFYCDPSGLKILKKLPLPLGIEFDNSVPPGICSEISEQSTIYILRAGYWGRNDPYKCENRAKMTLEEIRTGGKFLQDLYGELERSRTIDSSLLDMYPHFRNGINEEAALHKFLEVVSTSSEATFAELECYDNIFRGIERGLSSLVNRHFDSDRMRALYFSSMMLHPPFFFDNHTSLQKMGLAAEGTFGMYMFIESDDEAEIQRVAPRSTVSVIDKLSGLPTLMCDVMFGTERIERERIILQGMAACRQWRYILPEFLKEKNMLLGLSVRENFRVGLYLFHADSSYDVEVVLRMISLRKRSEALRLSRILFNYRDKLLDIVGRAEQGKVEMLKKVVSSNKLPLSADLQCD